MTVKDYKEVLTKTLTFWEKLDSQQKGLLINNTSNRVFKKGQKIHGGGIECLGIIIVISGELRTHLLSEDGKDITLYRLSDDDICILSAACLLESINFDIFIDAEEDSEILIINKDAFEKVSDENIYAENFSYKETVGRFSDVMFAIQQIFFMTLDQRLASFLYDEMIKNNNYSILLTHEQIAKYIGSAREAVSRALKALESKGIIKLFRGKVEIINKDKLKEMI